LFVVAITAEENKNRSALEESASVGVSDYTHNEG
jgi:hypothetical protein